ncbi:MAG: hypothetical protein ACW96U_08470, partial [Candidatus Heimdallarchaeaceae archaeon]
IAAIQNGTLANLAIDGEAIEFGTPETYADTSVYAPTVYEDGSQVLIKRGFSLIDLIEGHTDDDITNFDIEVYEVKVELRDGKEEEILTKMKFRNNEYLDLGQNKLFSEELNNNIQIDSSYVEYYFEIKVDDEIEDVVRAVAPDAADVASGLSPNNFLEPCED